MPGVAYQGAEIVRRSVEIGHPVIYVSSNYRLNSFGFSASEELAQADLLNLGLKDQRLAMKWVKQHISEVSDGLAFLLPKDSFPLPSPPNALYKTDVALRK